jgi:hypothetical protein
MEPGGRNQWQPVAARARKPRNQAKTVAVDCDRLPETFHGKEGVDRSSPSEAFPKVPANRHFGVVYRKNTRTHFGHIGGRRDASRRLPTSSDTTSGPGTTAPIEEIPAKEAVTDVWRTRKLTPESVQAARLQRSSSPDGRTAHSRDCIAVAA